ncbi:MAG: gliding motility lipoprotein GldH [Flavobacteriales bacterium]|nr:gliding motility lipoprotein GldH [Flavobacteriales bacterium]
MQLNWLKIFIFIGVLSFISCDSNTVFEENLKIKEGMWDRQEKAHFEFEIKDSSAIYDIYVNFRHGGDYPYQNIYLFTETRSPSGRLAKDTAQILLADNKGRWFGKGIGDIFDYQLRFKRGDLFPENGVYHFELEQAMRDEVLESVTDVGISVKKVNL